MDLKAIPLPLELVLNVISCLLPHRSKALLSHSHPITQTLLSFTLVCHETRRLANRYLREHCVYLSSERRLRSFLLQIPNCRHLCTVPSLLLSPFNDTIDDQPTACFVRELFNHTCGSLKRLVIDMPLRTCYPDEDHLGVRRILRQGFERLELLEEFVSVCDQLYLDLIVHSGETPVWRNWSKLRRLALYNVDANPAFWRDIAKLSELETLVLTRADGLRDHNLKFHYFEHTQRSLRLLLLNVEDDQVRFGNMRRAAWDAVDPQKKMTIMTYNIPKLYQGEDPIQVCQEYVRAGAEDGTLWSWEGEIIQHLPKITNTPTSIRLREPLAEGV